MSTSAATLSSLKTRLLQALMDSSGAIWSANDQEEAIRRALHEYSLVCPRRTVSSLALSGKLSANGREIDIASLAALVTVTNVWAPYTATDDKPNVRRFEHWFDQQKVYIADGSALANTDTARIFYTTPHTLNGLDSAGSTTFRYGDDSILLLGAIGYAAQARALDLTEQITLDRQTVEHLRALAAESLTAFRQHLQRIQQNAEVRLPQSKKTGVNNGLVARDLP